MAKRQSASTLEVLEELSGVFNLLPTEEFRNEVTTSVQQIIGFLQDLRVAIEKIPTREQMIDRRIPESLDRVRDFLKPFESAGRARSSRQAQRSVKKVVDLEEFKDHLMTLPIGQIEGALRDSGLTLEQLKEVLTRLGGSRRGARSKEQVIQRIVDEIRTRRELSGLRDGATP